MNGRQTTQVRFGLRTLFLLLTLLGVVVGWLAIQFNWDYERTEALRWMHDVRGRQQSAERGGPLPPRRGVYVTHAGVRAPWSLRLLGASGVERLEVHGRYLDSDSRYTLQRLRRLFPEAEVTESPDNEWR